MESLNVAEPKSILPDFAAQPFQPHGMLITGHAQTMFAALTRHPGVLQDTRRLKIPLPDGDTLVLHDNCPQHWPEDGPCVLLLHGVAGCHQSPYLVRIARKLNEIGVRSYRLDLRGAGAGAQLARYPGHAGRSEDAATAIHFLAEQHPDSPLLAAGFSMGGNILLKMLGEEGDLIPPNLISAASVAPPIDLVHCAANLESGVTRLYSQAFARMLLKQVRNRPAFETAISRLPKGSLPRTLVEFDERLTAPLSGYNDAQEYYAAASSWKLLSNIRCPTWIVSAQDDPLIPPQVFDQAELSDSISLYLPERGGHVAFYGKHEPGRDRWWIDWRIVDWVAQATVSG